jgi:hypothetical protein
MLDGVDSCCKRVNSFKDPASTNEPGTYNIGALPSGTYHVEVAQSGFKTVLRDVVVDVGNVTGLDIGLEVGESSQTVSVDAAPPILKTEQSSTSATVAVDAFGDLPLSAGGGRSPQNFKYLTPGVNNSNSINGSPQNGAQVSMDGLTVQNAENPGAVEQAERTSRVGATQRRRSAS